MRAQVVCIATQRREAFEQQTMAAAKKVLDYFTAGHLIAHLGARERRYLVDRLEVAIRVTVREFLEKESVDG